MDYIKYVVYNIKTQCGDTTQKINGFSTGGVWGKLKRPFKVLHPSKKGQNSVKFPCPA